LYIGVILTAMGADFYPRLTVVAQDNEACNRLVNEQTEVGLLVAVPGVIATLGFAPFIIEIFYSSKFLIAVEILRWQILGVFLRVSCWPLGFILLAKGNGKLFVISESISNMVHVFLIWMGISIFGLVGTGIAFFVLYVFVWILIYLIVKKVSGFTWSVANKYLGLIFLPILLTIFISNFFLKGIWYLGLSGLLTAVVGFYCLRRLCTITGLNFDVSSFLKLVRKKS